MLMENKNQIKLIEVNGKSYKIDTKIYIPAGEMKEIIRACHGFAGDKESSAIEALANEMMKNHVGVICFDFPGHGKSEVNADKLTIDNCIQDINGIEKFVIDTYGNIPVSIFATSFGAYITLINIARNNKKYKNIILRSPAIRMGEIYKNTLLRENLDEYKKRGYTKLGFEREMLVPYSFLEELEENDIFKIFENKEIQNMYIIQGDQDDIAPIADTKEFIKEHKQNIKLFIIPGADHRMKGPGELEKAIEYSKEIILR